MAKRARSISHRGQKTKAGYVPADLSESKIPDYVVVELRNGPRLPSQLQGLPPLARPRRRQSRSTASLPGLTSRRCARTSAARVGNQVSHRAGGHAARRAGPQKFAKRNGHGVHRERLRAGGAQGERDAKKIAKALNSQRAVWKAYVAPRPVPAMPAGSAAGSRNFEPAQGYLYDAPNGIGTERVEFTGAKGKGITICDIEGNWNRKHEDLPTGIELLGGTPIDDLGWRNHGTAVLGEMVSISDGRGCVGISHQAKAVVHSAVINGVFNTAGAISSAATRLKAGDVMLIELQATGPNGKYVAMQFWPDIFSAIKAAVDKGITVVEAAGNGDENFELAVFNGTGLQKDSGAIVVGAGVPPTNHLDFDGFGAGFPSYASLGVPRSRIFFSNYGKIVNVQGWGWHVTTLGYGDAQGGTSENTWYTLRFSGTSSASPIVTGAVACLQGRAKAKNGAPLTPKKVRDILMSTGTPQQAGPGVPLTQHIGPLPNLVEAMKKV